jgi:hypothetical protein
VPTQLDRGEFDSADAPWLIAIFTSATCRSCATVVEMAKPLATVDVAMVELEATRDADLHRRYGIDAVPTIVIADFDGVVHRAFLGPPTAAELRAAVNEAKRPGSTSFPEAGRLHGEPAT